MFFLCVFFFIEWGQATCLRFNRTGDYLASGLVDGGIAIFDFDTFGVLTVLRGHCRPIQSLSWSSSSRYLLSASRDWKCIIWDLATGQPHRTINFETPVWSAHFHPFNERQFVVSLVEDNARFVDFGDTTEKHQKPKIVTIDSFKITDENIDDKEPPASGQQEQEQQQDEQKQEDKQGPKTKGKGKGKGKRQGKQKSTSASSKGANNNNNNNTKQSVLTAIFSPNGEYIIMGTSRGMINIVKTGSSEVIFSKSITSSKIKSIVISNSGKRLVVNSSDRIIRLISLPDMRYPPPSHQVDKSVTSKETPSSNNFNDSAGEIENDIKEEFPANDNEKNDTKKKPKENNFPEIEWDIEIEHKYQDVVNRLQWNSIAISPTSEYILASTYEDAHDIYMWETSMGSLVKIYEGPKEELVEVEWHPNRPVIAATGLETGKIHLWSSVPPQRWSALAPDFIEVEENVVYDEAEDEFDRLYEDLDAENELDEEEEEDIDVLTEYCPGGDGSLESKKPFVIPVTMDLEDDLNSDSDFD